VTDVPLDPCGRTMDVLRSCYSTMARFDPGLPGSLRPIKWFFVPDGTPFFTAANVFRSLNYQNLRADDGGLGEVFGQTRTWSNGRTPTPYPTDGPCNPSSDFVDGVVIGGVDPINPSGLKQCCYDMYTCGACEAGPFSTFDFSISSSGCPCVDGMVGSLVWNGVDAYETIPRLTSACGPAGSGVCYVVVRLVPNHELGLNCFTLEMSIQPVASGFGPGLRAGAPIDNSYTCLPFLTAVVTGLTFLYDDLPGQCDSCHLNNCTVHLVQTA